MRVNHSLWAVPCALAVVGSSWGQEPREYQNEFVFQHPGVVVSRVGERLTRLAGRPLSFGDSAAQSAERFCDRGVHLFALSPGDLRPGNAHNGLAVQPVMPDRALGGFKFSLVYMRQWRGDVPVFGGEVRLLIANKAGNPLVWVNPSVVDIGNFDPQRAGPAVTPESAADMARALFPQLDRFGEPELVIWGGTPALPEGPRLAYVLIGDNTRDRQASEDQRLLILDAVTGEPIRAASQIRQGDNVTGTAKSWASAGHLAFECSTSQFELRALPDAKVEIVETSEFDYAAPDGSFDIDHDGTAQVTVRSHLSGRRFTVQDASAGNSHSTIDTLVTPPGVVHFQHNPTQTEYLTAQSNAYIHATIVRNLVLESNPSFPIIPDQEGFELVVNKTTPGLGNYRPPNRINLGRAGGQNPQYNNSAFGTVVYHEYGHHLTHVAGTFQFESAYGEGVGDMMSVLVTGESEYGVGLTSCSQAVRDADNNCQYDETGCSTGTGCGSEVHACGQLLSGCVWSVRAELGNDAYLRDLAVNSILLHTGGDIDPRIALDWLVLDDDDGKLANGTPNFDAIQDGFDAHSMAAPEAEIIGGGYLFTWMGTAANPDWNDAGNWTTPLAGPNDFPSGTGDIAVIEGTTTDDVDLVNATIRRLAISRTVHFGAVSGTPTLQVKQLTIVGDDEGDATVSVGAGVAIQQPPN